MFIHPARRGSALALGLLLSLAVSLSCEVHDEAPIVEEDFGGVSAAASAGAFPQFIGDSWQFESAPYHGPQLGLGFNDVQQPFLVDAQPPSGTEALIVQDFSFIGGGDKGQLRLSSGSAGTLAHFRLTNAFAPIPAPTGNCNYINSTTPPAIDCAIRFSWGAGRRFQFAVTAALVPPAERYWTGWVREENKTEWLPIGSLLVPESNQFIGQSLLTTIQYRGTNVATCEEQPHMRVRFSHPIADGRYATFPFVPSATSEGLCHNTRNAYDFSTSPLVLDMGLPKNLQTCPQIGGTRCEYTASDVVCGHSGPATLECLHCCSQADFAGMARSATGAGFRVVGKDGAVLDFGDAVHFGSRFELPSNATFVGIVPTPTGYGYWLVAADGGVFPYGDAGGYGSLGGTRLNKPVVGMAATATGRGYWLVAADGGIWPFGDAIGYGSLGGVVLNKPIVGMAATATGRGYWLVASDGGIWPFGDAVGYGSLGGTPLNKPIVGMAVTPSGRGYWLVASDGGIWPFGDAGGYGSLGGTALNKPIVGMTSSATGRGYWLVAADGGIFPFGDAAGFGSAAAPFDINKRMVYDGAAVISIPGTTQTYAFYRKPGDGRLFYKRITESASPGGTDGGTPALDGGSTAGGGSGTDGGVSDGGLGMPPSSGGTASSQSMSDPWVALDGPVLSAPAVTSFGADRIDLFARGTDYTLWHRTFNGTTWSAWQSLGGGLSSAPAAAATSNNRIDVVVKGTDNAIYIKSWTASTGWSLYGRLDGSFSSAPALVSVSGQLELFARDMGLKLLHRTRSTTGAWTAWASLGGGLSSGPAAVAPAPGRLEVFVRGLDGLPYQRVKTSTGWSSWASLSPSFVTHGGLSATSGALNAVSLMTAEAPTSYEDVRLTLRRYQGGSPTGVLDFGRP